jgi:hypothetical protein
MQPLLRMRCTSVNVGTAFAAGRAADSVLM